MRNSIQNDASSRNYTDADMEPDGRHPDDITVLKSYKGLRQTKLIKADGSVEGAVNDTHFHHLYVRGSSLCEIERTVRQLADDDTCFVIRGRAKDEAGNYHRRKWVGDNATLEDFPRKWLMVDIDKSVCDVPGDWQDNPADLVREIVRKALPDEFHNAGVVWQWSSSMGVRAGIVKVHLWFRLDKAIDSKMLKRWLSPWDMYLDVSVFQTGQPHYTASPLFEGRDDPVRERVGMIEGPDVGVPDIKKITALPDFKGKNRVIGRGYGYYRNLIGIQGFHTAMLAAVGSYISQNWPDPDIEWLQNDLRQHVLFCKAPSRLQAEREHRAGEHLDKLIEWTLQQQKESEEQRAKDFEKSRKIMLAALEAEAGRTSGSALQSQFFKSLK